MGNRVPVSGEDGLAALRLALALVESGKTHRVVYLDPVAQESSCAMQEQGIL